ncbi:MAG TPA: CoA-transferase [Syntrophorhabdaceae bacterium]|jgi:glutaconate CoA-transferase subunit B|nr:CoA-transferase [Syntrophorhabdaceae bacterium]HOS05719.1 CoA-transferase [Syntrophorhabdaceae bacterium]HPL40976.1 CoA-transferase [Syntrophorhabdaceae bacterium]HQM76862.1 CoA-transferase [Syntrophorhabdaceae bacterium]
MATKYTDNEMMSICAGRFIKDGDIVFAGTGVSMLAATAAKRIYAPKAVVFFETGGIDPALDEIPMAVSDLRVMYGTCLNSGLIEAFSIVGHRKLHTIAFLGAAQIDKYGNLNTTVIGDYHKPRTRFSGSGGACDVASFASGVITFMQHEKRRFVEKLDYLTSVGWYKGGNSRKDVGLQRGGAIAVVTNLCVMKFDEKTKEMYLSEYYPGISVEKIIENTGFEIDVSRAVESIPPSEEELRVLREEVDPQRLIL